MPETGATRLIELPNLAATEALAAAVAAVARAGDAILLEGELGAGKTVFARAFLRTATGDPALEVPSPTFTLVQSYDTRRSAWCIISICGGWRVPEVWWNSDWEEACDGIVLLEWPDRLGPLRPADALTVALQSTGTDSRRAVLSGWPDRHRPHRMSRERLIAAFLDRHGYGAARTEPLAQDASFRRYLRLTGGPRPAVLMDAPPPEDIRPFVRIAGHLAGIGVSVPEIFAADEAEGLLLEEDLGRRCLCSPAPAAPPGSPLRERGRGRSASLFDAAVDVLVAMQRAPAPPDLPVWDAAMMAETALATLFDWWWPAMFGAPAPDAARQDFAVALEAMLAPVAAGPAGFVHRDFFAGNLIWLPQRTGIRRVGVLDFQGAAIGHPAYDLASLLQDARRDIPGWVAERAIARYLAARPELNPTDFRAAYAACAAQTAPARGGTMGAPRLPRQAPGLSRLRTTHLAPAGAGRARPRCRTSRRRAGSLDPA